MKCRQIRALFLIATFTGAAQLMGDTKKSVTDIVSTGLSDTGTTGSALVAALQANGHTQDATALQTLRAMSKAELIKQARAKNPALVAGFSEDFKKAFEKLNTIGDLQALALLGRLLK